MEMLKIKTRFLSRLILFVFLALVTFSCKTFIAKENRYDINLTGICSRTFCKMETMFIYVYPKDSILNEKDIRPTNRKEINTIKCEIKNGMSASSCISFASKQSNYNWYYLDFGILENDSLNALSEKEKLKYVADRERKNFKDSSYKKPFPFVVEQRYVYEVAGLCSVNGSYFFCLNSENKIIKQFQEIQGF